MTTTMTTTKFYIIETNYTGPNRDQHADASKIEISASPAISNRSHEVCIDGWCGTTNDMAVYAYGEYDTIEEARAALTKEFGEVRDSDVYGDRFESDDEDVVETYKPGKYTPMGSQTAEALAHEIQSDIEADTTDDRIAELVAECEADANHEGYTLDSVEGLIREMQARRDELRDEMEDAS